MGRKNGSCHFSTRVVLHHTPSILNFHHHPVWNGYLLHTPSILNFRHHPVWNGYLLHTPSILNFRHHPVWNGLCINTTVSIIAKLTVYSCLLSNCNYRILKSVCLAVCPSSCLSVCVRVYTITLKSYGYINLKLCHMAVYENSSEGSTLGIV